jgi:hypothetical protein
MHSFKRTRHSLLRSMLDATCACVSDRVFYLQYSPKPILRPAAIYQSTGSDSEGQHSPPPSKKQKIEGGEGDPLWFAVDCGLLEADSVDS